MFLRLEILAQRANYLRSKYRCKTPLFFFSDNVNTHQSGEQDVENGANHHQQSKIRSGTAVESKTTCGDASSTKAPKPRQKYLHCVSCNSPFSNAWDLMVHVQAAHMMNIYQLADSNKLQQRVRHMFNLFQVLVRSYRS